MIENYHELQTAIADWLNRKDLTSRIPTFIQLAEKEIFRQLRCPGNESHVTYKSDTYTNSNFISLPADFQEVKNVAYGGRPLERISDQDYLARLSNSDASGPPKWFARLVNHLHFYPQADENLDVDMWYYETQGPLSDELITTRVMEFAPGLYLYGSLLQAEPFLIADTRVPLWQERYSALMGSIMDQAWEAEFAGSTNQVGSVYADDQIRRYGVSGRVQ